jgi:hypothetical protein
MPGTDFHPPLRHRRQPDFTREMGVNTLILL